MYFGKYLGHLVTGLVIILGAGVVQATEAVPVSPYSSDGVAVVNDCRPMFSWGAVAGAQGYELRVYTSSEEVALDCEAIELLLEPVLSVVIPAPALAWTPSSTSELEKEHYYVWYLRADYGETMPGEWSTGARFWVVSGATIGTRCYPSSEDYVASGSFETASGSFQVGNRSSLSETFSDEAGYDMEILNEELTHLRGGGDDDDFYPNYGLFNVIYGIGAGDNLDPSLSGASSNSFVGVMAGHSAETSDHNTFIGYASGQTTGDGYKNVMVGSQSGLTNTQGNENVFVGYQAGYENVGGDNNTFVGNLAGLGNKGDNNVCIGSSSGESLGQVGIFNYGTENTFVGTGAGTSTISGDNNTFIGRSTGLSNVSGDENTMLGAYAGEGVDVSGSVMIGYGAGTGETSDNRLYIANSDTSSPLIYGEFDNALLRVNGTLEMAGSYLASDRRWKRDIQTLSDTRQIVAKLRGVSYLWRRDKFPEKGFAEGRQLGFIAQEVAEVLPEVVKNNSDGNLTVSYSQVIPVLTEALKEQQVLIDQLLQRIESQEVRIKSLEEHR